ncbi:MAG: hypothetical protein JWO71_2076 [Candidatus Acidoferrum typicum]|nr:hypothetical protein [Candidatus Acidoferrum typicum]
MVRPLSFSLRTAESRLASANFGGHRFKFGDKFLDTVDIVLVNSSMLARPSNPSPFLPITSLQAQHYHGITHFFAQRQPSIPSIFNSFRTLSIATGVVPPSPVQKPERIVSVGSVVSVVSVLRSQCPPCCAFSFFIFMSLQIHCWQLLCFHIHTKPGPNPAIFSMRQLSDTILLLLCLRRQWTMAQPDRPVGSQSNHERCNRDA